MSLRQHPGRLVAQSAVAVVLASLVAAATAPESPAPVVAPPKERAVGQQACPEGTIADVQPQEAIVARLHGKDARIFIESCLEHGLAGRTAEFDTVLVLSGPEVMGGTVAVIAQGECPVSHKFLGLLEFIHAQEMVQLFQRHPALQAVEHLDLDVLTRLAAEAGEPAAAFHVGFAKAMGWGTPRDRPGSIDWLRQAAEAGHEPGMLGVGMALAGPGVLDEQVLPVGRERARDAQTDLLQACYWLRRLVATKGALAEVAQSTYEDEVAPRLSAQEKRSCRALLRQRKS